MNPFENESHLAKGSKFYLDYFSGGFGAIHPFIMADYV